MADSAGTRPVRLEMHSRKETDDVYDGIVYSKGASILEMLEDWVGPAGFQRSLHRYLTDHQFANASSSDLVAAIKQETGVDVGAVLFSFLDRPGAPVVRFSVVSSEGAPKLVVDQDASPWTIPVCLHIGGQVRRCQLVTTAHAELTLAGGAPWIWPNAYGSGYYRSVVSAPLLDTLFDKGYDQLEERERLAMAGDLEGLTSTGQAPAAESMRRLPRMVRDPDARVRARVVALAAGLAAVTPESDRAALAEWLQKGLDVPPAAPDEAPGVQHFFRDKR
jgi:alanyl aminopeptidase